VTTGTDGRRDVLEGRCTPEDLFRRLDELGISHETVAHEAVFTVEQAKNVRAGMSGAGHAKNLFVRNKRGKMALYVCREDLAVDLAALGKRLGLGRLSLGSADRLATYLGVAPGAVTPFAVINDSERKVAVFIDAGLLAHERVFFHPLVNTMTTELASADLVAFLEAEDHPPTVVPVEEGPNLP
jgi:Ala-tRNA(Pro) deacylase